MMCACLFCKIIAGDIPSDCVYEDDEVYAFKDIHPKAPTHVLVIPKVHVDTLDDVDDVAALGVLMHKVRYIANEVPPDHHPHAHYKSPDTLPQAPAPHWQYNALYASTPPKPQHHPHHPKYPHAL